LLLPKVAGLTGDAISNHGLGAGVKMLGHSRQRDALLSIFTVHRDGLDTLSRPSLFLAIKVNRPKVNTSLISKISHK
jgi:hypothetical protein